MKTYKVKFLVQAIVEIEVKAENENVAVEKAQSKMNKTPTFGNHLQYIDGREELVGWDLQDAWDTVYP